MDTELDIGCLNIVTLLRSALRAGVLALSGQVWRQKD